MSAAAAAAAFVPMDPLRRQCAGPMKRPASDFPATGYWFCRTHDAKLQTFCAFCRDVATGLVPLGPVAPTSSIACHGPEAQQHLDAVEQGDFVVCVQPRVRGANFRRRHADSNVFMLPAQVDYQVRINVAKRGAYAFVIEQMRVSNQFVDVFENTGDTPVFLRTPCAGSVARMVPRGPPLRFTGETVDIMMRLRLYTWTRNNTPPISLVGTLDDGRGTSRAEITRDIFVPAGEPVLLFLRLDCDQSDAEKAADTKRAELHEAGYDYWTHQHASAKQTAEYARQDALMAEKRAALAAEHAAAALAGSDAPAAVYDPSYVPPRVLAQLAADAVAHADDPLEDRRFVDRAQPGTAPGSRFPCARCSELGYAQDRRSGCTQHRDCGWARQTPYDLSPMRPDELTHAPHA